VKIHGVNKGNAADCLMHLDLQQWALKLVK